MKQHQSKKPTIFNFAALFFAVLLPLYGCSDQTPVAPSDDESHPLVWRMPFMAGSGLFHGDTALEDGVSSCTLCHGGNLEGVDFVPGCFECHFDPQGNRSPVGVAWAHDIVGHQNFDTYQMVCNNCHDTERQYDTGPGSCHDCHEDDN